MELSFKLNRGDTIRRNRVNLSGDEELFLSRVKPIITQDNCQKKIISQTIN